MDLVGTKVTVYNECSQVTVKYQATIFSDTSSGLIVITDEGKMNMPNPNLIKIHLTDEIRKHLNMGGSSTLQ